MNALRLTLLALAFLWRAEAQPASPVCCRGAGCWCDLALYPFLDDLMHGFGYDRCLEDGLCEACGDIEREAPHCQATGYRQQVVCLRCQGDSLYLPYCQTGYKIFWISNASNVNASSASPSAGLFMHSCSAASKAFRHSEPEVMEASVTEPEPRPERERERTTGRQYSLHEDGNEGLVEVLYFLGANALVLMTFGWSLRRQQRRQLEKTMEGLYSCIEDGLPSSRAVSPQRDSLPKPREHRDIRSPSPESEARGIGRSIESLAGAVAKSAVGSQKIK